MLSEGKTTVDTLFTLREGVLTMYSRKTLWVEGWKRIQTSLEDPSMLRGKKGFDRLIYACKNVFNQPMAWLFCDKTTQILSPDPLQQFFPTAFTSTPIVSQNLAVVQPILDVDPEILAENNREALEYFATERRHC
ncbi:hypothetical protein FPSE_10774 [Fusarium pseudograminearum CS3096]|uniref:Uncharacterized protein n=1 Tax=Fusarium pseudograminearum (strain CS3096) TaxID=1028729 RepID=K3VA77_FUSPC|nr:hypothetical protein FPSE_10774 [Fusarium pseudograminearum CS3096]EKJ69048.1 hypothetical protein FPSE_10774 [Fusarium pseudograminearum CS3096]